MVVVGANAVLGASVSRRTWPHVAMTRSSHTRNQSTVGSTLSSHVYTYNTVLYSEKEASYMVPPPGGLTCCRRKKKKSLVVVRGSAEGGALANAAVDLTQTGVPTSNVWELDFCSRPILDERGKKVWELLICDPSRSFEYSEIFSQ